MLLLGLESSGKTASSALYADGKQIALYTQDCGLTHSTTLLPMIEFMLKNCGIDRRSIDVIAVARGPGSFTGVRIGCATAKGLSWALDVPIRAVSTLTAMAYQALGARSWESGVLCPIIDARNEQCYNALFSVDKSGNIERLTDDRVITFSALDAELAKFDNVRKIETTDAMGVILAALQQDDNVADPVYIRLSQAEMKRIEK